jgi:hypothetical protein
MSVGIARVPLGLLVVLVVQVIGAAPSPASVTGTPVSITTGPTGTTQCASGTYYTSPNPTLYCGSVSYGFGSSLCSSAVGGSAIYVNGANSLAQGSSTLYWANAGIGPQFLYVTWTSSTMTAAGTIYVVSLTGNLTANIVISC